MDARRTSNRPQIYRTVDIIKMRQESELEKETTKGKQGTRTGVRVFRNTRASADEENRRESCVRNDTGSRILKNEDFFYGK